MALIHEFEKQGHFLFRYRGTLPLVILFPALLICVYNELFGIGISLDIQNYITWSALVIGLIGLYIRAHVVGHVPPNTSGRNTDKGQLADSLNRTGMYSMVRHPLYVGNFLMWAGPAILTMNLWFFLFFIAAFWLYYERIMYTEEGFLRKQFGDVYDDWSMTVPAFIPSFKNYLKPNTPFSWKKVLKQEKNGFTALFIVFWAFDFIPALVHDGLDALSWDFWSISAVASFIIYLILKSLKRSELLREEGR